MLVDLDNETSTISKNPDSISALLDIQEQAVKTAPKPTPAQSKGAFPLFEVPSGNQTQAPVEQKPSSAGSLFSGLSVEASERVPNSVITEQVHTHHFCFTYSTA